MSPARLFSDQLTLVGRGYRGRQAPLQRAQMPRFTCTSTSYICRKREAGVVFGAGIVILPRDLLPDLRIDRREQRIALRRYMHMGNFEPVGHLHGCSEDIATA